MDALIACFLLVGIAVFAYIGYVAGTIKKKTGILVSSASEELAFYRSCRGDVKEIISKGKDIVARGEEYMEIPPAGHLMDAGINFMAHIGATNLGKDGLNLTKEQASRVTMARNGFNVAGKRLAIGSGVPEIMNTVNNLTGGGGAGGGGGDMDLAGIATAFIKNKVQDFIGGVTGGGDAPPADPGGLSPL